MLKLVESKPVQRTKAALLEAFVELVLTRRYDEFRVADIIARAGVGRSTFYEHYDGKDDLLREGLSGPFGVLADIVIHDANDMNLLNTVEHFWENRRLANVLFAGPMRPLVVRTLAALIEHRLVEGARGRALSLPASLLAAEVAGGQLGLISAWLAGQGSATSEEIAGRLIVLARSVTIPQTMDNV